MAILATVWSLVARVGAKVWIALAIVLGVLLLLARAKSAGRIIERAETQAHALEIKNAQLREAARRPRDRGELVRRMREQRF